MKALARLAKSASSGRSLLIASCGPLLAVVACAAIPLYIATKNGEAAEALSRAHLAASILAETAAYDVSQGDSTAATRSMHAVMAAEPAVRQISLLDGNRAPLVAFGDVSRDQQYEIVEVPIQRADFLRDGVPSVKGFVRVFVAPPTVSADILANMIRAELAMVLIGGAGLVAAVYLTRRVSVPLDLATQSVRALSRMELEKVNALLARGQLGELHQDIEILSHQLAQSRQREIEASQTRDLRALVSATSRETKDKQRLLDYGDKLIEKERERIANEIHDELGSGLVGIRLQAEALARKAHSLNQDSLEAIARQIVTTSTHLYDGTRNIAQQLRPEMLELLGLGGAIEEIVRQLNEAHAQCRFNYQPLPPIEDPKGELSITAFRVTQEALTNIVKHAKATNVDVTLSPAESPRHVRIVVADNGQGFGASGTEGAGLGLLGMRERIERVGGVMSVKSDAAGTVLTFVL